MEVVEPAGGIEHSICCIRCNYSSIELRRQNLSNALLLYFSCLYYFSFLNPARVGQLIQTSIILGSMELVASGVNSPSHVKKEAHQPVRDTLANIMMKPKL